MSTLTREMANNGQKRKLGRMASDAAARAVIGFFEANRLSKASAGRVIDDPDFAARIHHAVLLALAELSVTNKYNDEEVESTYGYFSGYKPIPLIDQVAWLKDFYPELKAAKVEVLESANLPDGAEGWFALPNIWRPKPVLKGNYNDNLVRVLDLIKQDRRNGAFLNYRDGQLGQESLLQSSRTEAVMRKLSEEQGHPDILVVAAQFGIQHRGRSVRRALEVMADQGQFGLGAFAIGVMILTHPERLLHDDDLFINCAGDKYNKRGDDDWFGRAPVFGYHEDRVNFDAGSVDYVSDFSGSVSGFLPQ